MTIFRLIVDETMKPGTIDYGKDEEGQRVIIIPSMKEWFDFMKEYNEIPCEEE